MSPAWVKTARRQLADKWQIPTLVLAVVLVGSGIHGLLSRQKHVSVEQYVSLVETFASEGQVDKAAKLAEVLFEEPKLDEPQARRLHAALATAYYRQAKAAGRPAADLLELIVSHVKAARADEDLTAEDHRILAFADRRLRKPQLALEQLQLALRAGHPDRVGILKEILEVLPTLSQSDKAEYRKYLELLLAEETLSGPDLVWATERKAELLFEEGRSAEGIALIRGTLPKVTSVDEGARLEYALAYGQYLEGEVEAAERNLRGLLDRLALPGDVDAKAGLLAGRICLAEGRPEEALAFFRGVIQRHKGSEGEATALIGQAEALADLKRVEGARKAYEDAKAVLRDLPASSRASESSLVASVGAVANRLAEAGELDEALGFATLELSFLDEGDDQAVNQTLGRIAAWHRKLADQLMDRLPKVPSEEVTRQMCAEMMRHYEEAGNAFLRLSESHSLQDRDSANALWQAIQCYQRAGRTSRAGEMLERFTRDWGHDVHMPEALLELGHAYQSRGSLDRAIEVYQQLIREYERALPAKDALVPLARCYINKGPEFFPQAEKILVGMMDDERFEPAATQFRDALFLLGKLHYLRNEFDKTVATLEEALERYPTDRGGPEAKFIMAQAYRKLAVRAREQSEQTSDRTLRSQLQRTWQDDLRRSYDLYRTAVAAFEAAGGLSALESEYLKLAYVYQADNLYDLGDYPAAVRAYETVVDRYEKSPIALAAYVQIINAYNRLGQWGKVKAVLERMKWLLEQLPASAFAGPGRAFSREDWREWIDWNFRSGLLDYTTPGHLALGQREPAPTTGSDVR